MPVPQDDWRRMGQEAFLPAGTVFRHGPYRQLSASWDHDHCEFCGVKLVEPGGALPVADAVVTVGFATTDRHSRGAGYHWVCEGCFGDFADELQWHTERGRP